MIREYKGRKTWLPGEVQQLRSLVAEGVSGPEIAQKLNRTTASVNCTAKRLGFLRQKAFVPCRIGSYDVLCAELPRSDRKVLIRCPRCSREQWMRLQSLRYRPGNGCKDCYNRSRNQALPRFCAGETVRNFVILSRIRERSSGWQYQVRDRRCGHEKTVVDKPSQPFFGILSLCGCPLRMTRSDGYVYWHWAFPDGRPAYIGEHRILMEQALGRELYPDENVHHVNGVKDDNRPENLELWSVSQPSGQRVEDKITWAVQFLARYDRNLLGQFIRDRRFGRDVLGGIR